MNLAVYRDFSDINPIETGLKLLHWSLSLLFTYYMTSGSVIRSATMTIMVLICQYDVTIIDETHFIKTLP